MKVYSTLISLSLFMSSSMVVASECDQLNNMTIDANAIGLKTRGAMIDESMWVANDGKSAGEDVCRVRGHIRAATNNGYPINFQVNLPKQWNDRSLHFGGGGLNGVVIEATKHHTAQPQTEPTPLQQGFVTYGSDSGHQSKINFDGSFFLNDEALRNYGHEQLKKTHDVAEYLIDTFYGRAPQYRYFIGGSQGGHEGFDVVQRYPKDYDGVVAGYPAHNVLMLHLSANEYARAMTINNGAGWLNPTKAKQFSRHVYQACDALDGAEDNIISHIAACKKATAAFKLNDASNPIRCPNGLDSGDHCLSDAQITALNVQDTPYELGFSVFPDDIGQTVFPKWTPFEGSTFFDGNFPNLGGEGPHQALQAAPGLATLRYAVARDITVEPINGFDAKKYAGRITDLAGMISANSSDIDEFKAAGGKLIYFHGAVDDFIPVYSSIDYWKRLQRRYQANSLSQFVKFYVIPGMGHVTGTFKARMATLDVIQAWVEKGIAPAQLQAIDENPQTYGRTRPVCHYPGWPKFVGGDINQAASFTCVME